MTTFKTDKRRDGRAEYDLAAEHQPRPRHCSQTGVFCTHHGDCSCVPRDQQSRTGCALHGPTVEHPFPEPVLKLPTWRQP